MANTQDTEHLIKAKVLESFRRSGRFGKSPVVASEFCIGRTGVRADLVIMGRGRSREIVGIEIKSAGDTLHRLTRQLASYSQYFDRVIVVAAHRHQTNVRALDVAGLEIWEVERSGSLGLVRLGEATRPAGSLMDLMTQKERSKYRGLIARGPDGERDAFCAAFEDRHGMSSDKFWEASRVRVEPKDLASLSRFSATAAPPPTDTYESWGQLEAA